MPHILGVITVVLLHSLLTATRADDQHMERRTNLRAALANKLDPNFWPSRGRRSETDDLKDPKIFSNPHKSNQQPTTSDRDGAFWATRGRSITDLNQLLAVLEKERGDSSFRSKSRSTEEEINPFWANRGRSTEGEGPFWANRGRSSEVNQGRSSDDSEESKKKSGPFWANRGRSADYEGPIWGGRNSEVDRLLPFWGNHRRGEEEEEERLRRDTLYVEEPGYISLNPSSNSGENTRRAIFPEVQNKDSDMFWVARGKKDLNKRALTNYSPQNYARYRDRRDNNKLSRALEQMKAQFWPSRGKK